MSQSSIASGSAPVFERSQIVQVGQLGRIEYGAASEWQARRAEAIVRGSLPEAVAILEHAPTYTQGRRGGREHLLVPEGDLRAPLVDTDRGGDLTFHGPGQLVAWPLLRIRERGIGIRRYIRSLEESVIETTAAFGVSGERVRGRPGVWVEGRKLASIGVRVKAGVSRHGLALNVNTELGWFDAITACGIVGVEMTSLWQETGCELTVAEVVPCFERAFATVLGLRLAPVELRLGTT